MDDTVSPPALENFAAESAPVVTPELTGAFMDPMDRSIPGDWTDGVGTGGDGPIIMKPDEGGQGDSGLFSNNYYQTNKRMPYIAKDI